MREEIEAAALFISRLVNKNLSASNSAGCSSASSTHSSSSSSSSTSSESPPGFDEQSTCNVNDQDKVELFRRSLTQALYERFQNHWFPEQPEKGQAYRCIRLNEWDRHDIPLQKACSQCGIEYKDLQLPVELTLWVDPDEVTCRFGENKGSHCLVAKFKDGELKDDNFNLDINNIDMEIFRQASQEKMLHANSAHRSSDQGNNKQHNHQNLNVTGIMNNGGNQHFVHHHQIGNNNHQHSHNHHHQQPQQAQQQPPTQHHRSNIGKTVYPTYHHNYPNGCDNNGNPIYYFFN